MSLLRKLLSLSYRQIGLLAAASLYLVVARSKLAHQPMNRLIKELGDPFNVDAKPNAERAAEIAWALRTTAAKVPWRADCLIRAIAARQWARRIGLPFEFHLGVSVDTTVFQAHAWSLSGTTFLSGDIPELDRFREFDSDLLTNASLQFSE